MTNLSSNLPPNLPNEGFYSPSSKAKEVSELHINDDVDSSIRAHHHTLGEGVFQAAQGSRLKAAEKLIKSLQDGLASLTSRVFSLENYKIPSTVAVAGSNFLTNTTVNAWQAMPSVNNPQVFFTAPKSGAVTILVNAYLRPTTDGQGVLICSEVRAGSTIGLGTIIKSPSNEYSAGNYNNQFIRVFSIMEIEGLTPGEVYNTRGMYFQTAGSGHAVNNPHLKVVYR